MAKEAAAGAAASSEAPAGGGAADDGKGGAAAAAGGEGKTPEQIAAEAAGGAGAEDGKGGKGKEGSKDGDKPKAPDAYELAIPEDAKDLVDASDLKRLEKAARDKGLTNEQAQALLDEHVTGLAEVSKRFREETEADTTYGGEHLEATQKAAARALDKFAPKGTPLGDALRSDLVRSGYGNKLSVIAMLARVGKAMSEDQPAGGGGGAQEKKDTADLLYDRSTAKS